MATFLDQMLKHRADALAIRDRLDARVAALDVLIAQETTGETAVREPEKVNAPAAGTTAPTPVPGMTLADAVLKVMEPSGSEPVPFQDLLLGVQEILGSANEKSLRGTLPRMEKAGQLARVGRGVYALPTNADSPASAGLSVVPATTSQEGGTDHAEVRNDHDYVPGRHDGDGGSPPLVVQG